MIVSVDVQNVGQNDTAVGFAKFNTRFHQITGAHMRLYTVTDWLGLVPIAVCMGFGVLGLVQFIRRRSLFRVDPDITLMGVYFSNYFLTRHAAVTMPLMAVLAALCALCCMAGVKGRLRQVLSKSVVENIREL